MRTVPYAGAAIADVGKCMHRTAQPSITTRKRRFGRTVAAGEAHSVSFEDILRLCENGDKKANEAIIRMGHYLGIGLSMLVTGFTPRLIIIVGEVTRVWDKVGPEVMEVVREKSPLATATEITLVDETLYPRLRGAVSLILQKHFVSAPQ